MDIPGGAGILVCKRPEFRYHGSLVWNVCRLGVPGASVYHPVCKLWKEKNQKAGIGLRNKI